MEYPDEDDIGEIDEVEFTKEVLEFLKRERAKLKKAGLDVDFMIGEIEKLLQEADDARAHLEDLKRQTLMSLSQSQIRQPDSSLTPTIHLDMAAKDLREEEDVFEYFRRLQRQLRRHGKDAGSVLGIKDSN